MSGRAWLIGGHATMQVKVAGVVPMADERGDEMDRAKSPDAAADREEAWQGRPLMRPPTNQPTVVGCVPPQPNI